MDAGTGYQHAGYQGQTAGEEDGVSGKEDSRSRHRAQVTSRRTDRRQAAQIGQQRRHRAVRQDGATRRHVQSAGEAAAAAAYTAPGRPQPDGRHIPRQPALSCGRGPEQSHRTGLVSRSRQPPPPPTGRPRHGQTPSMTSNMVIIIS